VSLRAASNAAAPNDSAGDGVPGSTGVAVRIKAVVAAALPDGEEESEGPRNGLPGFEEKLPRLDRAGVSELEGIVGEVGWIMSASVIRVCCVEAGTDRCGAVNGIPVGGVGAESSDSDSGIAVTSC